MSTSRLLRSAVNTTKPRSNLSVAATAMTKNNSTVDHKSKSPKPDSPQPKKQFGKQNTHFLCFPLVNDTSIPQLAKSLQHFRDVTTASLSTTTARRQELSHETVPEDPLGNLSRPTKSTVAESLKVLPSVVHRPPGTYHLTIGVMQLDSREKLQEACDLLQSLDLKGLFREACRGPPANKHSRKWSVEAVDEDTSDNTNSKSLSTEEHGVTITKGEKEIETSITPMRLTLSGLSTFGSPKRASVIYANPHDQDLVEKPRSHHSASACPTLHNFALHLDHAFRQAGFFRDTRPITLHATIANMRYANQAKKGRTSKGRSWTYGKDRWRTVDARDVFAVFNKYNGDVEQAEEAGLEPSPDTDLPSDVANADTDVEDDPAHEVEETREDGPKKADDRDNGESLDKAFVFAQDILVDRVAICKMGATPSDNPVLGATYPPVSEKSIFE